mmetsp:Transcript_7782/g.16730  ORF Transcript_7782/g.16730 Transcript_7782/m.16730 type:complete len:320 (+) Transcript_7782:377-1336(+)
MILLRDRFSSPCLGFLGGEHGRYLEAFDIWHERSQHHEYKLLSLDYVQSIECRRDDVEFEMGLCSLRRTVGLGIVHHRQGFRLKSLEGRYDGRIFRALYTLGGRRVLLLFRRRLFCLRACGSRRCSASGAFVEFRCLVFHRLQHVQKSVVATGCQGLVYSGNFDKLGVDLLDGFRRVPRKTSYEQRYQSLCHQSVRVSQKIDHVVVDLLVVYRRSVDKNRREASRNLVFGCLRRFGHVVGLLRCLGHVQELLVSDLFLFNGGKGIGDPFELGCHTQIQFAVGSCQTRERSVVVDVFVWEAEVVRQEAVDSRRDGNRHQK